MPTLTPPLRAALDSATTAGGDAIGAVLGLVGRVRPSGRPLHPKGVAIRATAHRSGVTEPFGTALLDRPGTDEAVVRFSRSVGLPDRLPDIPGIAVRLQMTDGPVDLLLTTSGEGVPARFLFVPRRGRLIAASPYSSVLPYRTPTGPVVLGARPEDTADGGVRITLRVARPTGRWQDFGVVDVPRLDDVTDGDVTFDAVLNSAPDLAPYPWWARLREPAYSAARHARGEDDTATV
ncbi:MAG: hypothetical protein ACTHMS_18220 [Jatrophihabitans sp.]|uniref:hypothetical protein n=1 Tax=Jatrophihabitans sp. TaxID=1932789 RepID=UPI003F80315E